jgi:outer membrane protein
MITNVSAIAQTPVYNLQQCIDLAVNNNVSLKISRLSVEMQQGVLHQTKASMLPTLSGNASHGYNWGQTIDLYTNQFASERVQSNNFYLQSGVTVFNGFRLLNMAAQQQKTLMARKYDTDKALNDIMVNVATAYLQVLYSLEQTNISEGQLAITQMQLARTAQLVEGGMLARGDLLAIEAQLAAEEVNLIRARNAQDMAYLTLAQMMNVPPGSVFAIETPDLEKIEISQTLLLDPMQILSFALDNQPQVKSAELMVESAESGVKAAKGAALPGIFLSASLGTGYSGARKSYEYSYAGYKPNGMITSGFDTVFAPEFDITESLIPFRKQVNDNFNQSVSVYLTIPIFNGLQNATAIKNAQISLASSKYTLELEKQQLYQEIQQAHADASAALKNYQATRKSMSALKESFLYATERFNVGMINSLEYNDAKNRLIAAEAQMLSARYEVVFKTRLLEFYMGKEIHL